MRDRSFVEKEDGGGSGEPSAVDQDREGEVGGRGPDEGGRIRRADGEALARDLLRVPGALAGWNPCAKWEDGLRVRDFTLRSFVAEEMPLHIEPADWGAGYLHVEERMLPHQLADDLRERVPQALLRDLHRPVRTFQVTPEFVDDSDAIGRWHRDLDEARAARTLQARPTVEPLTEEVAREQERRRALRGEPWKPILDDDAPRRAIDTGPSFDPYGD